MFGNMVKMFKGEDALGMIGGIAGSGICGALGESIYALFMWAIPVMIAALGDSILCGAALGSWLPCFGCCGVMPVLGAIGGTMFGTILAIIMLISEWVVAGLVPSLCNLFTCGIGGSLLTSLAYLVAVPLGGIAAGCIAGSLVTGWLPCFGCCGIIPGIAGLILTIPGCLTGLGLGLVCAFNQFVVWLLSVIGGIGGFMAGGIGDLIIIPCIASVGSLSACIGALGALCAGVPILGALCAGVPILGTLCAGVPILGALCAGVPISGALGIGGLGSMALCGILPAVLAPICMMVSQIPMMFMRIPMMFIGGTD